MGDTSHIQWTDATWNPIAGCSVVSPGCTNCYAMRQAGTRLKNTFLYRGLTKPSKGGPVWTGELRLNEKALDAPLRWRKPRRIFVNSMSDLFHENVSDEWIDRIFAVMALCPQHIFQVLTKRPERMAEYIAPYERRHAVNAASLADQGRVAVATQRHGMVPMYWPLPNVWLGTSVEDQKRADERIPVLLETPAAVRFLSVEPMLGPVDLRDCGLGHPDCSRHAGGEDLQVALGGGRATVPSCLDWIIVGGESGPGARPFDIAWARSIIQQCKTAGVACFVKQLGSQPIGSWHADGTPTYSGSGSVGSNSLLSTLSEKSHPACLGGQWRLRDKKGGDPAEWPEDLRVREWPA